MIVYKKKDYFFDNINYTMDKRVYCQKLRNNLSLSMYDMHNLKIKGVKSVNQLNVIRNFNQQLMDKLLEAGCDVEYLPGFNQRRSSIMIKPVQKPVESIPPPKKTRTGKIKRFYTTIIKDARFF